MAWLIVSPRWSEDCVGTGAVEMTGGGGGVTGGRACGGSGGGLRGGPAVMSRGEHTGTRGRWREVLPLRRAEEAGPARAGDGPSRARPVTSSVGPRREGEPHAAVGQSRR